MQRSISVLVFVLIVGGAGWGKTPHTSSVDIRARKSLEKHVDMMTFLSEPRFSERRSVKRRYSFLLPRFNAMCPDADFAKASDK